MVALTLEQARALHLAAQGLLQPPVKSATPASLRACVSRMALLQIDTIHVVARSPYLVLFSRLGAYPPTWLDDALATGKLFETWAHEACFAPMGDLLLHRSYNRQARQHWGLTSARKTHTQQREHLDKLLDHIRQNGAVKSSDFERKDDRASAWWGWKDEKRWLEALFAYGELMVARRERFQRVYDLAERVAPQLASVPAGEMAHETVRQQFIERSVAALGVTQARWINDYFRMKPRLKDADLDALVDQACLLRVDVEGWAAPGYVHASQAGLLKMAVAGKLEPTYTTVLSPFDPVVWDRERAATLFDFDYRLECYTPEPKRVYGYFVLPILCRGQLIGRLDAKAHRAQGVFEVKSLFAQPGLVWSDAQVQAVSRAIGQCALWHGTPEVKLSQTHSTKLAVPMRRALKTVMMESIQT
ncbi:DNA glycosylase AlkZ-like family protein [Rhodoferax sp.]|uniref:winged helix-turn-helix domain-containing protein n=1 Tax=Rhodoferax sp. TaxID=50421 RepID=UPI00284B98D3|nr:crosslink repair DNA glycosylase YcaQ family protein [Rhodoferax sp.]MDR3370070.1 crosslink repair DNA glycosylase YcaQ family protein [Rhodoferax sp.]